MIHNKLKFDEFETLYTAYVNLKFSEVKLANYETSHSKVKKESFNYGAVPFGSHSKQQFLY